MTTVEGRDVLALPGEPDYATATEVFNLMAPARPVAAVTAGTVPQVVAALRAARRRGLPVRVHSTGHAAAAVRPIDGCVLVRTRLDGGVRVDPAARTARIPAGTRWGAVVDAAARHGLLAPHGSSPVVGVVGYLLRGGLSLYGRHLGLAANAVRAVELVTADGELRRVDASTDQELFWALRGGGGGFGVVTAVEIDLLPAAEIVTGAAFWPAAHAERLITAWLRWCRDAPTEATTSLRVLNLPVAPGVPPALAGRTVVSVDGAVLAETAQAAPTARGYAEDLLGPLRAVAEPVLDSWQSTGPEGVLRVHLEPTDPLPVVGDHLLLRDLDERAVAEFLRVLGDGSGSPLVIAGLRQLGGRYARPAPAGGVLSHLDAAFSYAGSAAPLGGLTEAAVLARCALVREALAPWDTGRTVPCFVERYDQPQRHLDDDQAAAVERIRRRVDPEGVFRLDVTPRSPGGADGPR